MVKNWNGIRKSVNGRGRLRLAASLVVVALSALAFGAACSDDDGGGSGSGELKVGALLDFTGDWQTLGKASKAAIELAEEDINGRAGKEGLPRISVTIKETGLDPKRALEGLKELYDDGVRVVIGPQSSSEVREILPFAKEKGIIVISQGSTSSTLSTGGDTVFRLPPDDRQETAAIAALMKEDGITAIVPAWRADLATRDSRPLCAPPSRRLAAPPRRGSSIRRAAPISGKCSTPSSNR
jgi:branched-chain amino acid transport system substrate-binding protein